MHCTDNIIIVIMVIIIIIIFNFSTSHFTEKMLSETNVAAKTISGTDGRDCVGLGGVKYRAAYIANKFLLHCSALHCTS